jgi:hypothetical protein
MPPLRGSRRAIVLLSWDSRQAIAFRHFVTETTRDPQSRSCGLPESYNLFLEHRRNAMSSVLTIATEEFFAFFS